MVRWKQAPLSIELLAAAKACFRPDLYDAALGPDKRRLADPADLIGAFAGPPFEAEKIVAANAEQNSTP
jgi:NitT/TauT family transport system ATP-binding protein